MGAPTLTRSTALAGLGLSAVLLVGCASDAPVFEDPSGPADVLPSGLQGPPDPEAGGEGEIDESTVHLAASGDQYSVWTARDEANNVCFIAAAVPSKDSGMVCGSEAQLGESGLSMKIDIMNDETAPSLQVYLLPLGVDANEVAKLVPGSTVEGQVVVKYGGLDRGRTESVTVPGARGDARIMLYGRT